MHPVLFDIGSFEVHTYGALGAFAFLVVAGIGIWRARGLGVAPERTADLIFWTAIIALACSRAMYVLQNPDEVETWVDWVNIRGGGLVFYGALLPGIVVASALVKRYDMPFYAMWDAFATALPLGHGLTRLGCFAAGCCYGLPSELPWAVQFHHPQSVSPLHVSLHPTQLYEAAYLFAIAIAVNVFYGRRRFDGQVALLYLMLYAGGRAVLETFRGDEQRGFVLPDLLGQTISTSQALSAVLAVVALSVFLVGARRAQRGKGGDQRG